MEKTKQDSKRFEDEYPIFRGQVHSGTLGQLKREKKNLSVWEKRNLRKLGALQIF